MNASAASPYTPASTVDPAEAEHFGRLAADWWDPKGSSAMLHRMNPARLGYIRDAVNRHMRIDEHERRPLAGRRALDIGCGAGLLAEPLARLGASVTGIDAAPENVAAARVHAAQSMLEISYICGGIEAAEGAYDLITCLEVVEHVADTGTFIDTIADRLAPDGLFILSTPNRTAISRLAMIAVGEGTGLIPKGTHDWHKFLKPDELTALLKAAGLEVTDLSGLSFSPARGFEIASRTALDYFVTAVRGSAQRNGARLAACGGRPPPARG